MTQEEAAYAEAANTFGSDPESPEENDLLRSLRARAYHDDAVPASHSTNWAATLAAVAARGPRCYACGEWTFRPVPPKQRRPAAQVRYNTAGHQPTPSSGPYHPRPTVFLCRPCGDRLDAVLTDVLREAHAVAVVRDGITVRVPLAALIPAED